MNATSATFLLVMLAACLQSAPALAQTYPTKPVRLIVPGPPGTAADIRARWIAEKLSPMLGQPIIVDNRAGAGGAIGTEAAAKSAADGYTILLVHQGTMAVNPHVYAKLGYDPLIDFAPITRLSLGPLLLAVNASLPVQSVADLVRLAKQKPGQINFGSPGNGTPPHLAGELFKHMAGIDVTHIPYKGGAQALTDLVAGQIAFSMDNLAVQLPQVKAGRIRAIATTGAQRIAALPEVPTVAEAGVRDYEYLAWMGIAAPAATPRAIVARLNFDIVTILSTPAARDWLSAQGNVPGGDTPEQFAAFIKSEHAKLGRIVREAGIKAD